MPQEIERKYLVTSDAYKKEAIAKTRITQGYLSSVPERTVRIRINGDQAYITIKGIGNDAGSSRYEWEKNIPLADAMELLRLCERGVIDKVRYIIPAGLHIIEVDEFFGQNQGLTVAEVELNRETEQFNKPNWFGTEVTGDVKYYNSMLMKNPYTQLSQEANSLIKDKNDEG